MVMEPIRDWLLTLDKEDRKNCWCRYSNSGVWFPIGMPLVRKIDTKYKLWEVRSKLA